MSMEFKEFNSLPMSKQEDIAELISDYTHGKLGEIPQMLPIGKDDILSKHLGYVAMESDTFSGYIGAIAPIEHNGGQMAEVGTLWVPKEFEGHGNAHKLLGLITGALVSVHEIPYAFCNSLSKGIFLRLGYIVVGNELVPPEAISTCEKCPMKPADGGCCDDILVFKAGL